MFLLDSSYWTVRQTKTKGRGVFAKRVIAGGTVIGDYLGRILPDEEAEKKEAEVGLYSMYYGPHTSIFPDDVQAPGVHLVNHSCMPNCNQYPFQGHTLIFSLRKIFSGEELSIGYDMEYSDVPSPGSYACSCGTLLCRGTMCASKESAKRSDRFIEILQRGWVDESRDMHTQLRALSRYPSSIRDHGIYDIFANTDQPPYVRGDCGMSTIRQIRALLRRYGVSVRFESIGIEIIGIYEGILLVEKTESPTALLRTR